MADGFKISPADLAPQGWVALSEAAWQLEHSWRAHPPAQLGEHVPPPEDPLHDQVLVELIKVDQEYRWRAGTKKRVEEYLDEWPALGKKPEVVAELLKAECLTRAVLDTIPTPEELRSRFPREIDGIDLEAIAAQAKRERGSPHDTGKELARSDTPTQTEQAEPIRGPGQSPLTVGQRFGRYEVRELLGHGGMGWVYRAYDTRLQIDVALKIPDPDVDSERFIREGPILAKAPHPNICPIYDVGQIDGTHYISMAFIKGQSLTDWMRGRNVDPREAIGLVCKVSRALEKVHEAGVVHRDIKPHNIMVDDAGEPLVMDFGLARPVESNTRLTSDSGIVGTIPYMSPEQANGEELDARSDLYSLGVVLYQLLTGKLPFTGPIPKLLIQIVQCEPPRPCRLRPELDPGLEAICLKAITKSREKRFQSAGEMAESLQQHLDKAPAATPPPRRRSFAWATVAAAAAAVLLVVIFFKTGEGTIELVLNDPNAKVTIDGTKVQIDFPGGDISVAVGTHELKVTGGDGKTHPESVTIRWRGAREKVTIPPPPPPVAPPGPAKATRGSLEIPPIPGISDEPPEPLIRWIETEPNVMGIKVSDDASTIYVAYWRDEEAPLQVLDASSGNLKETITFENHQSHGDVVISGDGTYLYTVHYYGRYMTRVDLRESDLRRNLDLTADKRHGNLWASHLGMTPDQQKIVVPLGNGGAPEDDNDRISIVDIAGGNFALLAEVPLDDEPEGRSIAFSDDSQFAYVITRQRKSDGPCLYEIRLTPPYEVARKLSFPAGDLRGVAVSTKLNRVFVSDSGHRKIWVVDLASFESVSGIELDGHSPENLAISPEQDLLVALCPANRKLFCADAEDGEVVATVDGLRDGIGDPEFSASGDFVFLANRGSEGGVAVIDLRHLTTWITFASNRDGESYQIYRMCGNGEQPFRLTDNHATERFPRWSPDGRKIAFISDREGRPKIGIMNDEGELITVLEDTDPVLEAPVLRQLAWSPDGAEIAFIGNDGKAIRVVDVKTKVIRTLVEGEIDGGYALINSLCWRGTDGAILFGCQNPQWGHDGDIFQLNPLTREISQLTDERGKEEHTHSPAASPDGSKIAVLRHLSEGPRQFEIFLMNAEGTDQTRVTRGKDTLYTAPEWFPDGKRIIYSAKVDKDYHIYAMDANGESPIQLTNGDGEDVDPDVCSRY